MRTRWWTKQTTYAITTMYLLIFLLRLLDHDRSTSTIEFVIDWIMVTLGVVFWPVLTIARLDDIGWDRRWVVVDIGWDRRWVVVFALPWTALIVAAVKTPNWIAAAALLSVLITQSFLVLRGAKPDSSSSGPVS